MEDIFTKTYTVRKLTGSQSQVASMPLLPWERAETLTDFCYPWEALESPLLEFRAVYDQQWFYCFFNVVDDGISVYRSTDDKQEVLFGDRVEIFLAPDRSLETYYGFEIDLYGRVYDYRASFYRTFDDRWSWPKGDIVVSAKRTSKGYQVFLALRQTSLQTLGLVQDGEMVAGLFRGKCSHAGPSMDSMRWISWLKPESPIPDFHIPSSFGRFVLD